MLVAFVFSDTGLLLKMPCFSELDFPQTNIHYFLEIPVYFLEIRLMVIC